MAAITNTYQTFTTKGIREDLSNIIYNISPSDTPLMSAIGREKASNTLHEWQTDALASASRTNKVSEGDEVSFPTLTPTVRLNNQTQISTKAAIVSGTNLAVTSAGRNNEMAYQISKSAKELKRDMESVLTHNQAKNAGAAVNTARALGSIDSWLATNVNKAADGANPTGDGSDARTNGTQRAFNEAQLKEVVRKCYDEGGDPSMVMTGAFNKQVLSGFTGGSTRFDPAENKRLVAAVDVYESDFSTLQVVPNRLQQQRSVYVIQPDMWAVAFLRDFQLADLSKTGDAEKKFMLAEYTLVSKNEKASGMVADVTHS
jgi:hypothetical protein